MTITTRECNICRDIISIHSFNTHLKDHNISPLQYYLSQLKLSELPYCKRKACSNKVKFISIGQGTTIYCSQDCSYKGTNKKEIDVSGFASFFN